MSKAAKQDFPLEAVLTKHTKVELLDICRSLSIKGVSGYRKPKLVGVMCKRIPPIIALKMQVWDQPTYNLVKQIITEPGPHYLDNADRLGPGDYLLAESIVFRGEDDKGDYLILPQEIKDSFQAIDGPTYQKKVERNNRVARLSKGLLHYYGLLSLDDLADAVTKFLADPPEKHEIWTILWELGFYNWDIVPERGYFCDGRMTNLEYVFSELQSRQTLAYRDLIYAEVWQAGDPNYYSQLAEEIKEVLLFFRSKSVASQIPALMNLLFGLVQTELSPPEIVFILAEHLNLASEAEITELALVVFDYYHVTPHWVLKGHSPDEIMDQETLQPGQSGEWGIVYDFATKQRIKADSPCPCGSGQEFSRCCGN